MKRTPIKSRSISPRSRLIARAESAVNAFVCRGDAGRPCISCFEYKPLTAGHYRSTRAAPELRFDAKTSTVNAPGAILIWQEIVMDTEKD